MEQVEDAIGIDSDGATRGRRIRLVSDGVYEAGRGWRHGHGLQLLAVILGLLGEGGGLFALAGNAVRYVDAGLGGVAGFAGVDDVVAVCVRMGVRVRVCVLENGGGRGPFGIGALTLGRIDARGDVGLAMRQSTGLRGGRVALFAGSVPRRGL